MHTLTLECLQTVWASCLMFMLTLFTSKGDYLHNLNLRQRRVIYNVGRNLLDTYDHQVTQRKRRIAHAYESWRSDVRHRSLIRIIGTTLPLRPPRRLKINVNKFIILYAAFTSSTGQMVQKTMNI